MMLHSASFFTGCRVSQQHLGQGGHHGRFRGSPGVCGDVVHGVVPSDVAFRQHWKSARGLHGEMFSSGEHLFSNGCQSITCGMFPGELGGSP